MGLDDEEHPPSRHQIVIWARPDHRGRLGCLTALAKRLRLDFLGTSVIVSILEDLFMAEQVQLPSRTTVHVTGSGGGSFIGVYLPRGDTQISLNAEGCMMEVPFFQA